MLRHVNYTSGGKLFIFVNFIFKQNIKAHALSLICSMHCTCTSFILTVLFFNNSYANTVCSFISAEGLKFQEMVSKKLRTLDKRTEILKSSFEQMSTIGINRTLSKRLPSKEKIWGRAGDGQRRNAQLSKILWCCDQPGVWIQESQQYKSC